MAHWLGAELCNLKAVSSRLVTIEPIPSTQSISFRVIILWLQEELLDHKSVRNFHVTKAQQISKTENTCWNECLEVNLNQLIKNAYST